MGGPNERLCCVDQLSRQSIADIGPDPYQSTRLNR